MKHLSLRFSVFELAADIGLETTALDGKFDPIVEEDEREPSSADRQRQTHSSDELADSPFPLTPPSSNDALSAIQPLALGQKRQEERPRFIERFPSPSPELVSTTPTPRTPPAKLRKTYTPTAGTPISEPLRLDYNTDGERDRPKRKENGKKKDRDDEREKQRQVQTDVDEEKKLLGGLLRFRARSKERKTAAKQAVQPVPLPPPPETMPVKPHTPPPLPIAERFVRPKDEISFRTKPRESGSSHGGSTSVGHGSATSHAESSDAHEPYIRPRDRSSRYERPHPAWRTAPSSLGNVGLASARGAIVEAPLPKEIHAFPPGQSIFDREPVKPNVRRNNSTESEDGKTPTVDMDMVNRYYGITSAEPQTSATVPSVPSPQSRFALAQALSPIETKPTPHEGALRPSPAPTTPQLPASPSPYIVPSPNPGQTDFGAQLRAKRGRMNIPPPMDPILVPPKRLMGAFNPPPTPPPTTELPPIPTELSVPQVASGRTGLQRPLGSPQPMVLPPSAAGGLRPGQPTSPLGMRSSSPSLRPEPSRLSPYPERPGTAPQEGGPPARAASPMLRGRAPAFPTRPVTPTRAPPAQQQYRPVSPVQTRPAQRPAYSPNPSSGPGNGFLINRRPEYDVTALNRNRTTSLDENEGPTRPAVRQRQPFIQQQPTYPSQADLFSPQQQQQQESSYGSRTTPPPTRKRSVRKTAANQSGYDSDDSRYSRHSRDTYYGRDTVYYDDQNMPPLPGSNVPPLPQRDFSNMEKERQAGRERLVRMLANREI